MTSIEERDWAFLPIRERGLNFFYEAQRDSFWTIKDLDFSKDLEDWRWLKKWNEDGSISREGDDTDGRKITNFLTHILAFFSQSDGIVAANLCENFQRETSLIKEASHFYSMQNAIEIIHSEVYAFTINLLIESTEEKEKVLDGINTFKSIKNIALWMEKNMNSNVNLIKRIIAFACIEGVIFSGAFCAIYWLKAKFGSKLPALCKSNEWIARDETLHTLFACEYYQVLCKRDKQNKLDDKIIHTIINESVELAKDFIYEAMPPEGFIGMTRDKMEKYIKCTANVLAESLSSGIVYENITNPFTWMILIALPNKTNFFEGKVSEYCNISSTDKSFNISEEY